MNGKHFRQLLLASLVIPAGLGLTGCDPDPIAPAGTALTITPSLGMVRNATVQVRNSSNVVVGIGATSSTGVATVTATGSGPFIIEVLGDPDAEYFDESTGTFLPFRAPDVLRAIAPTGTTQIGVTGLTDMAHALWAANSVPLSNTNINAANGAILAALGSVPVLSSILTPPTPLDSTTPGSLSNTAADAYAAILAGIADLGSTAGAPALEAIRQLRRDVADGVLDGNEGSTAIAGLLYSGGFATTFQNRVDNRINTLGNTALAATTFTVNTLTVPTWSTTSGGGGGGGGAGTTPATINPALVNVYNLTYHASAVGGPYTDGQSVQVTVSSSGMLFLPAGSLTNPFYRNFGGSPHTPEIIWRDSNQIEYALSDNSTGTFNEINIGDMSRPTSGGTPFFLGQLRAAPTAPDFSNLQALAGSYTLVTTQVAGSLGAVNPNFFVGDSFTFNIASTGAISSARINQTFTPGETGTTYGNYPTSFEPHMELIKKLGDNGTPTNPNDDPTLGFRLYVQNGVIVGARLAQTAGFAINYIVFEARPIAAAHQNFIDDLLAVGFPDNFTVLERNTTGFARLPALCTTFEVTAASGSVESAAPMTLTINSDRQPWEASFAKVSGNDALRTLMLRDFNVILDDNGNVTIEERAGNTIVARASNNAAQATAAGCSTAGGSGSLRVTYTGTTAMLMGTTVVGTFPLDEQETVTGTLSGITETAVRDAILRDNPTAESLVVTTVENTTTRKQFSITFTTPPGEDSPFTSSYQQTWLYETL